jgi:hypothetical protein
MLMIVLAVLAAVTMAFILGQDEPQDLVAIPVKPTP